MDDLEKEKVIKSYEVYLREDNTPYLKETTAYTVDIDSGQQYNSPDLLYKLGRKMNMHYLATEKLFLLMMNAKNNLIAMSEVSHGAVSGTIISSREICQTALLAGAVNVALIHNHPSGDPTESMDDVINTKKTREALNLVGICLLDHVIVGRDNYVSLHEKGLF